MMRLLRREEQLRHSSAQQTLFALAEYEEKVWQIDWLDLVDVLQAFVVAEIMSNGKGGAIPSEDIHASVEMLRATHILYPNDAEMRAVSVNCIGATIAKAVCL